jgi:hypothetical protein
MATESFILAILLIFACGRISYCMNIVLDLPLDNSGLFLNNSCSYADLPAYYEDSGCPLNPPANENSLVSRYGFWSTCGTLSCDIIFDAGYLPSVRNMSMGAYFDGEVCLSLWGKDEGDEEEWQLIMETTHSEDQKPTFVQLSSPIYNLQVS